MEKSSEINTGRHCVFDIKAHLVFIPKYRKKIFSARVLEDLKVIFEDICLQFESKLVEFNGEDNHVHLLISYPPKYSISKIVNSLKGVSSRLIRKKNYSEVSAKLWGPHFWSPSYYAGSCGGVTIEQIKKYIEGQKKPDSSPSLRKGFPQEIK
jgi:putative transposase